MRFTAGTIYFKANSLKIYEIISAVKSDLKKKV